MWFIVNSVVVRRCLVCCMIYKCSVACLGWLVVFAVVPVCWFVWINLLLIVVGGLVGLLVDDLFGFVDFGVCCWVAVLFRLIVGFEFSLPLRVMRARFVLLVGGSWFCCDCVLRLRFGVVL